MTHMAYPKPKVEFRLVIWGYIFSIKLFIIPDDGDDFVVAKLVLGIASLEWLGGSCHLLCCELPTKLNLSQVLQFVFQKNFFLKFNYPQSILLYTKYWKESASFFSFSVLWCKLGFCLLPTCCRDDGISNGGDPLFYNIKHYFLFIFPLWIQKKNNANWPSHIRSDINHAS